MSAKLGMPVLDWKISDDLWGGTWDGWGLGRGGTTAGCDVIQQPFSPETLNFVVWRAGFVGEYSPCVFCNSLEVGNPEAVIELKFKMFLKSSSKSSSIDDIVWPYA